MIEFIFNERLKVPDWTNNLVVISELYTRIITRTAFIYQITGMRSGPSGFKLNTVFATKTGNTPQKLGVHIVVTIEEHACNDDLISNIFPW